MSDERSKDIIFSEFMWKTCRIAELNQNSVSTFYIVANLEGIVGAVNTDRCITLHVIPSGSTAEFYIEPLFSCVGDIDVMSFTNDWLAIPAGHPPPTKLPAHFPARVELFEILHSRRVPGYVYLRYWGALTKTAQKDTYIAQQESDHDEHGLDLPDYIDKNHNFVKNTSSSFDGLHCGKETTLSTCVLFARSVFRNDGTMLKSAEEVCKCFTSFGSSVHLGSGIHGPANRIAVGTNFGKRSKEQTQARVIEVDTVLCIRCLEWPPEAADWPTRQRIHGWPDSATVDRSISNGCDLVATVHPQCKDNPWMMNHQWRLSFSRAEIVLLNSWIPVQQIVYHMLRYILKREHIKSDSTEHDEGLLRTYHVKTLMLWSCEQQSPNWDSSEYCLIKLCSDLLRMFASWIASGYCPHYFLDDCNLFDCLSTATDGLTSRMKHLSEYTNTIDWFVENYVRPYAFPCFKDTARPFHDVCSNSELETLVNAAIVRNDSLRPRKLLNVQYVAESLLLILIQHRGLSAQFSERLLNDLPNLDRHLVDFFVAMACLHVARKARKCELSDDLLDILWTLLKPDQCDFGSGDCNSAAFIGFRLITTAKEQKNALATVQVEMSKAYFLRSLRHGEIQSELCYCLAYILLTTRSCPQIKNHCLQVIKSCGNLTSSHTLDISIMSPYDKTVASALGMKTLYQFIRDSVLKTSSSAKHECFVTTKLIFHYLSAAASDACNTYHSSLAKCEYLYITDALLYKSVKQCLCESETVEGESSHEVIDAYVEEPDHSHSCNFRSFKLTHTLEELALETLEEYRHGVLNQIHAALFDHPYSFIVNEYQLLYLYKHGLLEDCMQLCRKYIIYMLATDSCVMKEVHVSDPEDLSLIAGDLASLLGIVRILCPYATPLSMFCLFSSTSIKQLTFTLYMLSQCLLSLPNCSRESVGETLFCFCWANSLLGLWEDDHLLDRLILRLLYRRLELYCRQSA